MDWVLSFDRANDVYQDIIDNKIWVNTPAKAETKKMLDRTILLPGGDAREVWIADGADGPGR